MSHKIASFALLITLVIGQTSWSQARLRSRERTPQIPNRLNDQNNAQNRLTTQIADIEIQIKKIQSEQQKFNTDLKALQQTAQQEKASKTLEQIQTLIKTRNTQYNKEIQQLQQRQRRFQTIMSDLAKRNQAQNRIKTVAPAFTVKSLTGDTIDSKQYKGKILVMEWFNPECQFTRYAYQRGKISTLLEQYGNHEDVAWIKICSTRLKNLATLPEFVSKEKITVPVINDATDKTLATLYYAKATPQFIIVGKDGKIVYSGMFDNSLPKPKDGKITGYVAKALEELTQGKPVTTPFTAPSGTPISAK